MDRQIPLTNRRPLHRHHAKKNSEKGGSIEHGAKNRWSEGKWITEVEKKCLAKMNGNAAPVEDFTASLVPG